MSETYDPGEHTVEEVKAYVEEHPDEIEAIHEAEVEGKDRKTLVEWMEGLSLPGEEGDGSKDAANDPTVIDSSPADAEGNRPEGDRTDPNTYPDPENLPHTP